MAKNLSDAIKARKQLNATPEPIPQPAPEPPPAKAATTKKRFHTTLYPDQEIYRKIRIALLEQNEGRDFNQLVNELLAEWLEANS